MTYTKQITFEGRSYTVPVWVEWVARDSTMRINGFEKKPRRNNFFEAWATLNTNRSIYIATADWRDSLTKV